MPVIQRFSLSLFIFFVALRLAAHTDSGYVIGTLINPASGDATIDPATTNRFICRDHVHALHATCGRPIGDFGLLTGLRAEQALIATDQVTTAVANQNDYTRLYPTLHLSCNLTEISQLQLSYSHRIRRPESDDLNPFPEYQDPYNLRTGNPRLRPQDTHSVEGG